MKIGIYADAHFSRSSSILTGSHGNKYSMRLDSLIDSFKWMYDVFDSKGVDLIVNLGDLISSDTLDPETNSALHEALMNSKGVNEIWLIGNHEMKSRNSDLNSLSLIKGYDWISVVDDWREDSFGTSLRFMFLSFTNDKDKLDLFEKKVLNSNISTLIFTHHMYKGMVPMIDDGFDIDKFSSNKNIMGIFNGHIHTGRDVGIYHQVGSLSGMSFGDDYSYNYPGIMIFDTDTNSVERISNPYSTLFYTIDSGDNINTFESNINKIPVEYNKLLRIRVPVFYKEEFSSYLLNSDILSKNNVIAYRLKSYDDNKSLNEEISNLPIRSRSVIDSLRLFVENESTPYSKEEMFEFINEFLI